MGKNFKERLHEKKEKKRLEKEEYERRVINYNRVVSIELANRSKDKKANPDCYISIQNVNKIYDNLVQAVYDFNLDIKKNEFVVFVGPSGCGKSTNLRMIAGLEEITSGNLFIDGRYANSLPPKDRNIAMVFQSYALYPHMTVYDNMAFSMRIKPSEVVALDENKNPIYEVDSNRVKDLETQIKSLQTRINKLNTIDENLLTTKINNLLEKSNKFNKDSFVSSKIKHIYQEKAFNLKDKIYAKNLEIKDLNSEIEQLNKELEFTKSHKVLKIIEKKLTKEEIDERVHEAAKILQIEEYLGRKPRALSGGQRQRVALGRAICKRAKLFLMDEPLSNLDAKLRVSMRSEIIRIHKTINATTIYVTHDQTEAMTMADRIVIMNKGVTQQIGTPKEIYNNPKNIFVATFIGSPSMNILNATIENNEVKIDENTKISIKEDFKLRLRNKILEKLNEVNNFIENGLNEEIEKELNVKRAAVRLNFLKKGYHVNHDEAGNSLDPFNDVKLDEFEMNLCKNMYEEQLKVAKVKKEKYEKMLQDNVYQVKLGIRPEDVYVENSVIEPSVVKSDLINVTITIPELLGHEYFLHTLINNKDFILKTSANNDIKENENVNVFFNLEKIHLFDTIDDCLLV